MSKLMTTLRIVAINVAILLSGFGILELGVRLYAHVFMDGKHFFRVSQFISPWITSADHPTPRITKNGDGIFRHRDTPIPKRKPNNTIRIIAVGGSTTLNERSHIVSGFDYAKVLEKLLNKTETNDKRYEVLNAGADAYSTAQSLINIQFRLVDFEPDVILLMHNINDLTANFFGNGADGDYANKYLQPYFLSLELQTSRSLSGFLYQSRLLTGLDIHRLFATKWSINYTNSIDAGARIFRRNLTYIAQACKLHGISLVFLSQPHQKNVPLYDNEHRDFIRYNRIVQDVAKHSNSPFIDMFELMGDESKFFVDSVHFTPNGIKRFSSLLHNELLRLNIL